jgi:hypothetical protein
MKRENLVNQKFLKTLAGVTLWTIISGAMEYANYPELPPETSKKVRTTIFICGIFLIIGIMTSKSDENKSEQSDPLMMDDAGSNQTDIKKTNQDQQEPMTDVIKLKIAYGSKLIEIAKTGDVERLKKECNKIPQDELQNSDWLNIFMTSIKYNIIKTIVVAAAEKEVKFSNDDWRILIAYAEINNDTSTQMLLDMIPPEQMHSISSWESHLERVKTYKDTLSSILANTRKPFDVLNTLDAEYLNMSEEYKLSDEWQNYGTVLDEYFQTPNISVGQMCTAIHLVKHCILEINQLRKNHSMKPIEPIVIRVPEELYSQILSNLETYASLAESHPIIGNALQYYDPEHPTQTSSNQTTQKEITLEKMPQDIIRAIAYHTLLHNQQKK